MTCYELWLSFFIPLTMASEGWFCCDPSSLNMKASRWPPLQGETRKGEHPKLWLFLFLWGSSEILKLSNAEIAWFLGLIIAQVLSPDFYHLLENTIRNNLHHSNIANWKIRKFQMYLTFPYLYTFTAEITGKQQAPWPWTVRFEENLNSKVSNHFVRLRFCCPILRPQLAMEVSLPFPRDPITFWEWWNLNTMRFVGDWTP